MRRIDTVDGQFEAGDPTIRKPGSRLPSWFMNMLQDELCNVVEMSGLELDPGDPAQLYQAIQRLVAEGQGGFLVRRATIPTEKIADEVYVAGWGEMVWVETSYFTGYRSPLCGARSMGTLRYRWCGKSTPWAGCSARRPTRACGAMPRKRTWSSARPHGLQTSAPTTLWTCRVPSSGYLTCAICSAATPELTQTLQMQESSAAGRQSPSIAADFRLMSQTEPGR